MLFWDEHQGETERIWQWATVFAELDIDKGKTGNDLDEFNAHRFLEKNGETKSVKQLRDEIKEMDLDFNRRLALIEYLLFRYHYSIQQFVARPQGDNKKEIDEAQAQLEAATHSMDLAIKALEQSAAAASHAKKESDHANKSAAEARRYAEEARKSAEESKKRAEIARQRSEEAKSASIKAKTTLDELQAAEDELKSVLAEIHKQEDARDQKTKQLNARIEDESLGVVQKNKAKNELAQHQSEDPLPLRQAKITQTAATKRAERARIAADSAHADAENARKEAEKAQHDAEHAAEQAEHDKKEAERSQQEADHAAHLAHEAKLEAERLEEEAKRTADECENKFNEAQRYLDDVKSRPGNFQGSLWWIDRDLKEARKYMPKRKQ